MAGLIYGFSALPLKYAGREKGGRIMIQTNVIRQHYLNVAAGALAVALSLLVAIGQVCGLTVQAQGRQTTKKSALTGDQRVAHVLSRLTFGARPGDFERVKAIGVNEFIREQLDSDSVDDVAVQARLRKLPTLGMATPVIFEQYTPPKPAAPPSPAPAKSPDKTTAASPGLIAQNSNQSMSNPAMNAESASSTNAGMKTSEAMPKPAEMQTNVKNEDAGMMSSTPSGLPAWGPHKVSEFSGCMAYTGVGLREALFRLS